MPTERRPRYAQAKYWMVTIRSHLFMPWLPPRAVHIKGQLERGHTTGYEHWQLCICYEKKVRLSALKNTFGPEAHCEPTVSSTAQEYVWKDDTAVENTRFELGKLPVNRNSDKDWENIWKDAREGNIEAIPADIRVRCYNSLKKIEKDYMRPDPIERVCRVYHGITGMGKSRRAWQEGTLSAYPKDPCTKFWDGYAGQENVIIDEFRGAIGISHLLRWLDRYPVCIETKGSGSVLRAKNIWITSNLHPEQWYPDLDEETKAALMRRLIVEEMNTPYYDDIEN